MSYHRVSRNLAAALASLMPFLAGTASADEVCWDGLRKHLASKPEAAPQARAKALKACDSPAHRKDPLLKKLLQRCDRLPKPDVEECKIDAYRWNQWFEYPGPVVVPKDREKPAQAP